MFTTFKKLLLACTLVFLMAASIGCACMNTTAPTPTVRPTATLMPTSEPSPTNTAAIQGTPDLSASPGIGEQIMDGIENFMEGTEVKEDEIPEVVKAIREKYSGATIVSIQHAMQQNMQVYAVEIKTGDKTQTVYAKPDGTLINDAEEAKNGNS